MEFGQAIDSSRQRGGSTTCPASTSATIRGWPAARFLAALAEQEVADRARRRIERHMAEARLPAGKTLTTFDFKSVPMLSKAQVMALASGDVWLKTGPTAIGLALVENGWRVLFALVHDYTWRGVS